MSVEAKALRMDLDLVEPLPAALDMGAPCTLIVAVPETGLDLAAANYRIVDGDTIRASGLLGPVEIPDRNPDLYDPRNGPADLRPRVHLTFEVPDQPGSFAWQLVVPAQRVGTVEIEEARLLLAFSTTEHRTSLAAWDVPSPVQAGERFRIKVGAKCSAGCNLHGLKVHAQVKERTTAPLGPTCWPQADGLYWCEMEIVAPPQPGLCEMPLTFEAAGLKLPHRGAQTSIAFVVTPPAAPHVEVALRDRETGLPIGDAQVRFGPHRKAADESGMVSFDVASGVHRLFIWRANCEFDESMHDVQQDLVLTIDGRQMPAPSPFARWEG